MSTSSRRGVLGGVNTAGRGVNTAGLGAEPLDPAKGVTAELVTESSLPAVLDALTMNEYCVPFVSPEQEAEVPLMVQLAPAGSDGIEVRV